jgi:hypothetical protein
LAVRKNKQEDEMDDALGIYDDEKDPGISSIPILGTFLGLYL